LNFEPEQKGSMRPSRTNPGGAENRTDPGSTENRTNSSGTENRTYMGSMGNRTNPGGETNERTQESVGISSGWIVRACLGDTTAPGLTLRDQIASVVA
jgi:hypothetical protein